MSGETEGMDVSSFDGVGSEVLERALDNASPDQIESILELVENGATDAEIQQSIESGDTAPDPSDTEPADLTPSQNADEGLSDPEPVPVVTEPEPVAAVSEPEPEPAPNVVATQPDSDPAQADPEVLAKDGKNTIPYSVLQDTRAQAAAHRAEADELTRKNALLQQQLEEAEITPKELPENVRITPEKLKELEEYGEIGEVVGVLAQQNAMLMEQLATNRVQPDQAGVHDPAPEDSNPLAANPDTARWADSDTDWRMVESVNSSLDQSPEWQHKSLEERVPEIVRRTKAALGEATAPAPSTGAEIDQAAQDALNKAKPPVPNSLSDAGGEIPGSEKPLVDRLAEGDTQSVEAYLEKQIAAGKNVDDVLNAMLPG